MAMKHIPHSLPNTKSQHLLRRIQDIPSSNLTLVHLIIHHLQLRKPDNLERRLNQSPREEVNRLRAVLAITNIRSLDADHLDDRLKHRRLEVRTGRQSDANNRSARPNVLRSLLERLLIDGDEDDSMGAQTIGRSLLHISDEILASREVDKGLGAQLLGAHLLLLGARVDGDGAQAHDFGVLAGERSQTAAGADDGDELAWLRAGFFQALVDGDAGAQDGRDGGEVAVLGDAGYVRGFGDAVLLEGAVDGVAREQRLGAQWLVGLLAEVTGETGAVEPFDAGVVADFDVVD